MMTSTGPYQWPTTPTPPTPPTPTPPTEAPAPSEPKPKAPPGKLDPERLHKLALHDGERPPMIGTMSGWVAWLLGHGHRVSPAESGGVKITRPTLSAVVQGMRSLGWQIDTEASPRKGVGSTYTATFRPDGSAVIPASGPKPAPPHKLTRRGRVPAETMAAVEAKASKPKKAARKVTAAPVPVTPPASVEPDLTVDDIFNAVVLMLFPDGSMPTEGISALIEWRAQTESMLARIR